MRRGGAHLADAEEPFDVAPREELPVEVLELTDGVGDGEQPPGLRGHRAAPQRQVATPAGRGVKGFARATSATSAGRPPDPLGAAAAEAAVPGAKNIRTPAIESPGGLRVFPFGADPGRTPAGPLPFWVNLLSVLNLGRFLGDMSLDMLVNVCSKIKIRVGADRLSHKGSYGIALGAGILRGWICGRGGPEAGAGAARSAAPERPRLACLPAPNGCAPSRACTTDGLGRPYVQSNVQPSGPANSVRAVRWRWSASVKSALSTSTALRPRRGAGGSSLASPAISPHQRAQHS